MSLLMNKLITISTYAFRTTTR